MNTRAVLMLFVVGAIAIGLLIVLFIGIGQVDEDGRENDAPPIGGVPSSSGLR